MELDRLYPTTEELFEEARDGLRIFLKDDRPRLTANMMRMALSPNIAELTVIQEAFSETDQFPRVLTWLYEENKRQPALETYSSSHYLRDLSPSQGSPRAGRGAEDVQRVSETLKLHRWTESLRFASSGDDEIDAHLSQLVNALVQVKQDHQSEEALAAKGTGGDVLSLLGTSTGTEAISSIPVEEHSAPSPTQGANCFVYLVPQDANFVTDSSLFVRRLLHGGLDGVRSRLERSIRKQRGFVGTYNKFRAEYSRVLEWLAEQGVETSKLDEVVPFAPFHPYNVDGFLVVGSDSAISAAVGIIDSLAMGRRKLELTTEFFVRAFGLPGLNRFAPTTSTSARHGAPILNDHRMRSLNGERAQGLPEHDPAHHGLASSLSEVEVCMLGLLYDSKLEAGMSKAQIVSAFLEKEAEKDEDVRDDFGAPPFEGPPFQE